MEQQDNAQPPRVYEADQIPKPNNEVKIHEEVSINAHTESFKFMNRERWQLIEMMSKSFVQAGALPSTIKNAPQVAMILQAGFEAGLKPIQALNSFYFVNGRIAMFGDTAIQQVIKGGHIVRWGVYENEDGEEKKMPCTDTQASVTIIRGDNDEKMSAKLTLAEAKELGIVKDTMPWRAYPGNMLKYRVFSRVSHFLVPDALNGVAIGDVNDEPVVVEKTPENTQDLGDVQVVDDSKESGQMPTKDANSESLADALNADDNEIEVDEQPPKKKRKSPAKKKTAAKRKSTKKS